MPGWAARRKALNAIARSILAIIFHLLADPQPRNHDLGPAYYHTHIDRDRNIRNPVCHLQALAINPTPEPIDTPAA